LLKNSALAKSPRLTRIGTAESQGSPCGFTKLRQDRPTNIEDYLAEDGYQALGLVVQSMSPEQVIDTVMTSGCAAVVGGFLNW